MRVRLLNFEEGPVVPLLNFEGGPRVPRCWVLGSWSHFYIMPIGMVIFSKCCLSLLDIQRCICVYRHIYIYIYIIYIYIYIYIHTYIYIYIYVICKYICIDICFFLSIALFLYQLKNALYIQFSQSGKSTTSSIYFLLIVTMEIHTQEYYQ